MPTTDPSHATLLSVGLLVARLVFGLFMAAHGAQKLFGWFRGHGLVGTGGFLESLGFRPGRLFATLAASAEFAGGLLLALGFLGPVGPALMISAMLVAMLSVHWTHGAFAAENGVELPLLYATAAFALALTGFGRYALDAAFGLHALREPAVVWVVLVLGILGGLGTLALRRRAPGSPAV